MISANFRVWLGQAQNVGMTPDAWDGATLKRHLSAGELVRHRYEALE
jgi:hypothetical protein